MSLVNGAFMAERIKPFDRHTKIKIELNLQVATAWHFPMKQNNNKGYPIKLG